MFSAMNFKIIVIVSGILVLIILIRYLLWKGTHADQNSKIYAGFELQIELLFRSASSYKFK